MDTDLPCWWELVRSRDSSTMAEGGTILFLWMAAVMIIRWATPSQAIWLSLPSSGTKCVSQEIYGSVVVMLDYSLVFDGGDDSSQPTTISARVLSSSPWLFHVLRTNLIAAPFLLVLEAEFLPSWLLENWEWISLMRKRVQVLKLLRFCDFAFSTSIKSFSFLLCTRIMESCASCYAQFADNHLCYPSSLNSLSSSRKIFTS